MIRDEGWTIKQTLSFTFLNPSKWKSFIERQMDTGIKLPGPYAITIRSYMKEMHKKSLKKPKSFLEVELHK